MPRKQASWFWLRISVYTNFIILVALISIRFQSWHLMFLQKIPSDTVPSHSGAPGLTVGLPIKHKSQPFPSQFSPAFNVWKSVTLNQMNSSRFEKVCVKMYPHTDELRTNRIEGRRGGGRRGGGGVRSHPSPDSSATMCKQQVCAQGKRTESWGDLKINRALWLSQ